MFSKTQLRNLIIPLMIEQTLALTVGMIDTIMVAGVGEDAVSAVSLVDAINFLVVQLFAALATGGAIVSAQYLGLKDHEKANHAAKQLVIATFLFSLVLMGVCLIFNNWMLSTFFGSVEPTVMYNAQIYFFVTALSYPFIATFNSAAALFRGMGNSKIAMINALIMNVANITGNVVFIYGLDLGVFGAALATLISRIIAAATMLWMLRNPENKIFVRKYRPRDVDIPMIKRIFRIGIPNGLENSIFQIGKIIVTSFVAVQGTASIAAHAVANSLAGIEIIPAYAMGLALITVVAQCVGAGKYDQAEYYTKKLMKQAYLYTAILNITMLIFMKPILGIYQLSDITFHLAFQILVLHGVGTMLIWPLSFTLPNALRAAGDVKYPMVISIISMWAFRILLSYIFTHHLGFGVLSIWIAMVVDWVFRSCFLVIRWKRKKWQRFSVI